MKRGKGLTRKTPLKASARPVEARKGDGRAPTKGKPSATRRKLRALERFKVQFHSQEFVEWGKRQPCVACGRVHWEEGKPANEIHHEPPRSRGGTWQDVSVLCPDDHTRGPGARHTSGPVTFWKRVGRSYVETNAATQLLWSRHCGTVSD